MDAPLWSGIDGDAVSVKNLGELWSIYGKGDDRFSVFFTRFHKGRGKLLSIQANVYGYNAANFWERKNCVHTGFVVIRIHLGSHVDRIRISSEEGNISFNLFSCLL